MLPVSWDTIRLFLHVLAATIWVGGQVTLAAQVPVQQGRAGGRAACRRLAASRGLGRGSGGVRHLSRAGHRRARRGPPAWPRARRVCSAGSRAARSTTRTCCGLIAADQVSFN